jgi:hypothetical protein
MIFGEETITPEKAALMLQDNDSNRPVNMKHVNDISQAIKRGDWKLNGDTIRLNGSKLIDGQHRLLAIVKAGVPVPSLVVRGLPEDVFDTIDIGKRRNGGDCLSIRGAVNVRALSAALMWVHRYMTGTVLSSRTGVPNTLILKLYEEHPGLADCISDRSNKCKLAPPSLVAACTYLFRKSHQEKADQFFDSLYSGANLQEASSVFRLREYLLKNSLSRSKMPPTILFALFIKAWNSFKKNREMKQLMFRTGADNPEAFPIIE